MCGLRTHCEAEIAGVSQPAAGSGGSPRSTAALDRVAGPGRHRRGSGDQVRLGPGSGADAGGEVVGVVEAAGCAC